MLRAVSATSTLGLVAVGPWLGGVVRSTSSHNTAEVFAALKAGLFAGWLDGLTENTCYGRTQKATFGAAD